MPSSEGELDLIPPGAAFISLTTAQYACCEDWFGFGLLKARSTSLIEEGTFKNSSCIARVTGFGMDVHDAGPYK